MRLSLFLLAAGLSLFAADLQLTPLGSYGSLPFEQLRIDQKHLYALNIHGAIEVYDLTDPSLPVRTQRLSLNVTDSAGENHVNDMHIQDKTLYIGAENELLIYDLTSPGNPRLERRILFESSVEKVAAGNGILAVGLYHQGVSFFDINDNFRLYGHLNHYPRRLDIDNNLVLLGSSVFRLEDLKGMDPEPTRIAANILGINGPFFLFGNHRNENDRLVDYSSQRNPHIRHVFIERLYDNQLYTDAITARNRDEFVVFEYNENQMPEERFRLPTQNMATTTYDDGLIVVAHDLGGFSVYPLDQGGLGYHSNQSGVAGGLWVEDNIAYLAHHNSGLRLLDVSAPGEPVLLGRLEVDSSVRDVAVRNHTAYAVTNGGLSVIDVNDPTQPHLLSSLKLDHMYTTPPRGEAAIHLADDLAIVLIDHTLFAIDISDPQTPRFRSRINRFDEFPTTSMVWRAPVLEFGLRRPDTIEGGLADAAGLIAYDLSDPDHPRAVTSTTSSGHSSAFLIHNEFFYGVNQSNNSVQLDVVDLGRRGPLVNSRIAMPMGERLTLEHDGALLLHKQTLLAANAEGIGIIDIAQPDNPKFRRQVPTPGMVGAMTIYEDRLFATDILTGALTVFQLEEHPLQQVIPWVVNNSGFDAKAAIYNHSQQAADVHLKAVDRQGDTRERHVRIEAGAVFAASAESLFDDFSGYSLYIYSTNAQVKGSFLIFNREASSGGNSPSQTTALAIDQLTPQLVFGYVPGDQTAAVVLSAPLAAKPTPVTLTLHDNVRGVLATTQLLLNDNQPTARLVSDLFSDITIPKDAALHARAGNQTLLAGVTFVFNELRQPSMASALPVKAQPMVVTESSGQPDYLTVTPPMQGFIYAAADGSGVEILDLATDPAETVGGFTVPGESTKWLVPAGDNRLAVLTNKALILLDLADPITPKVLDRIEITGAADLVADDGILYLGLKRELLIIDTADNQMNLANRMWLGERLVDDPSLALTEDRLYLFYGSAGIEIQAFDRSNPLDPQYLASHRSIGERQDIAANGNLVAVTGRDGLLVVDFSDLQAPQTLYSDVLVPGRWVTFEGQTLWQGQWEIVSYDFSNSTEPIRSRPESIGSSNHAAVVDGIVYLASHTGLSAYDPNAAKNTTPATLSVQTQNQKTTDCGDRSAYYRLGMWPHETRHWCFDDLIVFTGDHLSLVRYEEDTELLHLLGTYPLTSWVNRAASRGNRLHLTTLAGSLLTFDISDPTQPQLIGQAEIPEPAASLDYRGNSLVLTTGDGKTWQYREGGAQHLIPWVVDNAVFRSQIALFNRSEEASRITLEAVDRNGRTASRSITLGGGVADALSAGSLFPGMNGYSLRITSNTGQLHVSFLTSNLEEISGGNSPSQTTAAEVESLTDDLLFGYVPGDQIAALVLTAAQTQPDPGRQIPVVLSLHDDSGLVSETQAVLTGNQPLALLASELFDHVPADASIQARTLDGTPLAGTTFVFNQRRQPSMARAISLD